MTMKDRRRALMVTQKDSDIPIGVNLYDQYADGVIDNERILSATVGTTEFTTGTWNVYLITAPMPYSSDFVFDTNSFTTNSSGSIVTDKNGVIIYSASNALFIKGIAGQEKIKAAEASLGLKAAFVRFSTTRKSQFVYKRIE